MVLALALALTLLSPDAHAFCGTYMGSAGSQLFNNASQVAVVRQGTRTTLTLANDYEGDLTQFALVVPVPQVLGEDDVDVVEPDVFAALDLYSSPRRVAYECSDFRSDTGSWGGMDGGGTVDTGSSGDTAGGVEVEAEFSAGEYDIVILSAEESGGLIDWLNAQGYAIPDGAEELLGEYIEAGSYFFAAKVDLSELPDGATWLSPLRFGYDSDVFSLPIRLGTINADGAQDLVAYVINDEDKGQVHISNYPQVELEDECMWPGEGPGADETDFGAFYAKEFQAAVTRDGRPGWLLEYSWSPAWCDPCTTDPPSDAQLQSLGFDGSGYEAWFTRLHMRYGADDVDQDLVFYESGLEETDQVRYIDYNVQMEDRFPVCGLGMVEDPGSCDDGGSDGGTDGGTDGGSDGGDGDDDDDDKGCSAVGSAGLSMFGVLGALGLALRRRR